MREPVDVLIAEEVYAPVLEEIRRHEGRLRLKIIPRQERSRTLDLELLGDPEILMATFPPRNLRDLGRLRWLQLGSAGYEQIFDLPVVEMGITVTNASGVSDVPIAECSTIKARASGTGTQNFSRSSEAGWWESSAMEV